MIPLFSYGQLKGKYCYDFGFFSECLILKNDFSFKYYSGSCDGTQQGFGHYSLSNNELILIFESDSKKSTNDHVQIIEIPTSRDSIKFSCKVICEKTKEPASFANVFFKNDNDTIIAGQITEIDGSCLLSMPKSEKELTLNVSLLGFKTFSMQIIPDVDFHLSLTLALDGTFNQILESGDTLTYKIKQIKKRRIKLKKPYNYSKFETYKRHL